MTVRPQITKEVTYGFCTSTCSYGFSLLDGACRITELIKAPQGTGSDQCGHHGSRRHVRLRGFLSCLREGGHQAGSSAVRSMWHPTRFDKVHELDSEARHLILCAAKTRRLPQPVYMVSQANVEDSILSRALTLTC